MIELLIVLLVAGSGWFYAGVMAYREKRAKAVLYRLTFFLFTHVIGEIHKNDDHLNEWVEIEMDAWKVLKFDPIKEAQRANAEAGKGER